MYDLSCKQAKHTQACRVPTPNTVPIIVVHVLDLAITKGKFPHPVDASSNAGGQTQIAITGSCMEAIRSKIVWTQVLAIVVRCDIIDVHLVTVLEQVVIHILHSVNYLYPVLCTAIWHFTKFIIFLRHKSSGMWHQVNQWAVPDILWEHSVFTFRVKQWLLDPDDEVYSLWKVKIRRTRKLSNGHLWQTIFCSWYVCVPCHIPL